MNDKQKERYLLHQTNAYREQAAAYEWTRRATKDFNIFGTLKFHRTWEGEAIQADGAEKIASLYFNRLDRVYYPSHSIAAGIHIERVVFRQEGYAGIRNPHFHFLARILYDEGDFIAVAKQLWHQADRRTDPHRSFIEIRHSDGAANYLAHEVSSLGFSNSLMTSLTALGSAPDNAVHYATQAQKERIAKAKQGITAKPSERWSIHSKGDAPTRT